jgi:hypothetical protein
MVLTFAEPAITAAYFAVAPPEAVFSWMAETAASKKDRLLGRSRCERNRGVVTA